MQVDPDILIVIATLVSLLALSSVVASWAERRLPRKGLVLFLVGLGLLAWVHLGLRPGGLTPQAIPDAFIHVAAMILN